MMTDKKKLYGATETLFHAFHYLRPRMHGGDLAPPRPMNAEALAGCILHGCMSRLVRELQEQTSQGLMGRSPRLDSRSGAR
jgi:hypothetical protein